MNPNPDPIDVHVGARIRLRRNQLHQSQGDLAKALGVSFQQVQKYERGSNRISASMLHRCAKAQGQPVGFYYEGAEEPPGAELTDTAQAASKWLAGSDAWKFAETMIGVPEHLHRSVLALARDLQAA